MQGYFLYFIFFIKLYEGQSILENCTKNQVHKKVIKPLIRNIYIKKLKKSYLNIILQKNN